MLTVEARGLTEALARVDGMGPKLQAALRDTVTQETFELQRHVVQDKLSGQVLNRRSGALSRSITARMTESAGTIRGIVGTNLAYGRIHEYGRTIHHPGSVAREGGMLRFEVGGAVLFRKRTAPHEIRMPERSYLRSALRERREAFFAAVRATIARVLGR
jgi:phage gpG-like protein